MTAGGSLAEAVSVPPPLPVVPKVLQAPLIRRWISPDPKVLARLVIPKLAIDVVIREGTDATTLRRAVGHMAGTATPGGHGNFVLTGHRDTFFRPLRNIGKNDKILAITPGAMYTYRVYAISVVALNHVQVLRPTSQPECTLITCFPFDYVGNAPRRFIVQARLIETKNQKGP
jgi:sortase A